MTDLDLNVLNDFEFGTGECCRCGKNALLLDFMMPHQLAALQLCGGCIEQIWTEWNRQLAIPRG